MTTAATSARLRDVVYPLTGSAGEYDRLLEWAGDRRLVLLGEATHGTHEFYGQRALITKRLLDEKGFHAVAVEGDWPDAYRVNAYVQGRSRAPSARAALDGFQRFPAWMWRNTVVEEFVDWLKGRNERVGAGRAAGFYGLDLYSLHGSIQGVLTYLDRVDPLAAQRARYRYSCFEDFGEDAQAYGYAASFKLSRNCEEGAIAQLAELQQAAMEYARRDGRVAEDDYFHAQQDARVVLEAERYYRGMFGGRVNTWNLRDQHMTDTLGRLLDHLDTRHGRSKVVVWEHNSHIGDARATDSRRRGEVNVGQLTRERWPGDVFSVGMTTYEGTVTAASDWDQPAERKRVRPALPGSFEALFHEAETPRFLLKTDAAGGLLAGDRLERAIGVIYRPETERLSHYFYASLPRQFDAVLHVDETRALAPLERTAGWHAGEPPETYPSGQ